MKQGRTWNSITYFILLVWLVVLFVSVFNCIILVDCCLKFATTTDTPLGEGHFVLVLFLHVRDGMIPFSVPYLCAWKNALLYPVVTLHESGLIEQKKLIMWEKKNNTLLKKMRIEKGNLQSSNPDKIHNQRNISITYNDPWKFSVGKNLQQYKNLKLPNLYAFFGSSSLVSCGPPCMTLKSIQFVKYHQQKN